MKKLLFLYNPHAGKAHITARLHEVVSIFQSAGYLVTVYATTGPRDAVDRLRELSGQFDHIVCAGGDGTLSEVISGLIDSGYQGKLGYLPAGSTNDFSKTLGIPVNEVEAAAIAVGDNSAFCDIGSFNHCHQFVYVAAFGLFTAVSYQTPQEVKNLLGHLAYVLEGIRSLAEVQSYHIRLEWDGGEIEDSFLYGAVSNSVSIGGFSNPLSDQVVLDDGVFEVMLVKSPRSLLELNAIIAALLSNTPNEKVVCFQTSRLSVQSAAEIPWTLDGENGGKHCFVNIENLHNAVNICSNVKPSMKNGADHDEEQSN